MHKTRIESFLYKKLCPISLLLQNVRPNAITATGLIFAIIAGVFFALSSNFIALLLLGSIFTFISGCMDIVDGEVARLSKMESKAGDFLDHVSDRVADVVLIIGLSVCAYGDVHLGTIAIVGVLLLSYMGALPQCYGISRIYIGLLSRMNRMLLLVTIPVVQFFTIKSFSLYGIFNVSWIDLMFIGFIFGSAITIIQRILTTTQVLQ